MAELIFLLVFSMVLFFSGVTMLTLAFAVGVSFMVMILFGMLGMVFRLLPWLIIIVIAVWLYKKYID